ncbi:RteC domain-containing protein [Aquimarina rubra]|uniref:RteC domain-containing protein n=1 Tax=Aquimarina rubra TaxID=1920033 RepID=A0ABW5LEF4_9FLAO
MVLDFEQITNDFKIEVSNIEQNSSSILDCANQIIILARNILSTFKKYIQSNEFKKVEAEIHFFKHTKQIPLTPLIYYSEIRSFELQFPKVNRKTQEKFVGIKMRKLNRFFSHNLDFVQYVDNGLKHFDLQFYTRNFIDFYHITSSDFYFQDPEFTTPRDMLLGKVKANKMLVQYLQKRLEQPKNGQVNGYHNGTNTPLKWTASKTGLTELIYALHCNRVINNGNVEIKEIVASLQKVIQFDLGDFYKIYSEIKSRKISRTKFLDDLSAGLITQMNNSEE